jgi:hypothetical protein
VSTARDRLSRLAHGLGIAQVRRLRRGVDRLEGDLTEHVGLQRSLAEAVDLLEKQVRARAGGRRGSQPD